MLDGDFRRAAELLERHYGRIDLDACRADWLGCVRFLLECEWSATKLAKAWPELAESWLNNVEEVARSRREELWEFLREQGFSASLVAFVHKLANWWHRETEQGREPLSSAFVPPSADPDEPASAWQKDVVRQDRGLAARLACVVFAARQFPMTRGIWRVGCRHQWISWHDDPAEAPDFFEHAVSRLPVDFAQGAEWLIQLGEDFCTPKPKCVSCPLLPLLGPEGPCEPET